MMGTRLVHTPDLTVSTGFGDPARFASAYACFVRRWAMPETESKRQLIRVLIRHVYDSRRRRATSSATCDFESVQSQITPGP